MSSSANPDNPAEVGMSPAAMANGFLAPGMEMVTKPFAVDALAARIREMIVS